MTAEVVTVAQLEAGSVVSLTSSPRIAPPHRLDSAIGDADHGINMDRGMQAVLAKLDATPPGAADELFKLVGMTLVSSIGGASGPLYGTFFLRFGTACGPASSCRPTMWSRRSVPGSKAWSPAASPSSATRPCSTACTPPSRRSKPQLARGCHPAEAFTTAWRAAVRGRDDTIPMVARKGRASYLGERSAGHQDPGATSSALLFEAAAGAFEN